MALDIKKISGLAGGSGKAPGIYSYTTPDSIADVTANGYWNELGLTLQIGDIIIATLLTGGATIVRTLVVNLSTSEDSKAALITAFVGDIRAIDEAGYQSDNFSGNIGAGSSSRLFTYRNNTDVIATIVASGYFNELATVLVPGDLIIIVAGGGLAGEGASYARILDVLDGVVTTQLITLA